MKPNGSEKMGSGTQKADQVCRPEEVQPSPTLRTNGAEVLRRIATSPVQKRHREYTEEEIEAFVEEDQLPQERPCGLAAS
jgi:hypothetical protein